MDVAQAFWNLCLDPGGCIKSGIKWKGLIFIDVAIAFNWVHGTAAFQLCSEAISCIMKLHSLNLHCYIDDYVAGLPRYMMTQAVM